MLEIILMVGGVVLVCALIFSPFVLWDFYKKKKQITKTQSEAAANEKKKEIIWWQALLCGLVLASAFVYVILWSEGLRLPGIIAYPYYGLIVFCSVYVQNKKVVWKRADGKPNLGSQ